MGIESTLVLVAPLLLGAVAFVVYCLIDLTKAEQVRGLPKWAWGASIVASVPFGGLAYLLWGRQP